MPFPVCEIGRQGKYCVTYYVLGKEKINDLHGMFINVGTFDTLKEAETAGADVRLKLGHLPGRVRVHYTGHAEKLLGDDAAYSGDRTKVSKDEDSFYGIKQQEEHKKLVEEKKQIEIHRKELEAANKVTEDITSLEYYSQLHARRRMMEETIVQYEQNMASAAVRLAEINAEIGASDSSEDVVIATHKDNWRAFVKEKIGTDQVFILRERVAGTPAESIEDAVQTVLESQTA